MSFIRRIIGGGTDPGAVDPQLEVGGVSRARSVSGSTSELLTVTAAPSTVFVELGAASEQAAIARNGVQIPVVAIDPAALGEALGHTTPVVTRVVSQSIQPGVSVAKGTSVDIVLAVPTKLNVGVLKNAFQPMATTTLDSVYKTVVRDNAQIQSVLARNTSAATLNQQDQATLTSALSAAGYTVTSDPGHTIDAAFSSLQAAYTFGS